MTSKRKAKISGTGMFVPPKVVTNKDLEVLMDTSDEWIRKRSGIEERRYVEGVGTADLAFEAAKSALKAANLSPEDLDLIVVATLSPDHQFPGTSAILQAKLGLNTTPSMDIKCQCSGFIYSLNVAKLFVESGQYDKVLVVGAEAHSPILDFSTEGRDVTVLFGDGAGAAIIEPSSNESEILNCILHSQGEFADKLNILRPGTKDGVWLTDEHKEKGEHFPYMEGRYVFKHAVTRLGEVVRETLEKNSMSINDIDHFLFHQANLRINESLAKSLGIPSKKCHNNIMKYGNCSAAAIPMLLDECVREEKIKKGDNVLMAAFGAGFTWAGSIFKW